MEPEQIRKEIEESLDKLYDRDGESCPILKYKGVNFPNIPTLPESLSQIHLFPAHKDDIFICAYPCCGTHWMWEVTSMLLKEKAERIQGVKEEFMIDFIPARKFSEISPPRLFNTHLQPHFLPETVLSQNKIIFVVRNPKDVVVSFYKHSYGMLLRQYNGTFPSYFEMFIEKKITFGDYFEYMNKWWQVIKDNPNCLVVSYEEASQNLLKTVNKIGHFLGKPPSPELAAGITELCTFDRMKKEKVSTMDNQNQDEFWKPNYSFYRKGKVATWKEWLTVAQSERIDARVKTELADCGIPIVYSF
ncbi:unnamed protein product [Acanthosepion pharaonis]|uniref:Sulfotransferase domain-containing protein n=1 Tax=Acanthosepion pharaonis TaxID=158019 RepID=A0A812CGC5_ACAPH|nr:unnamed protein product [Sepia pharaonis]